MPCRLGLSWSENVQVGFGSMGRPGVPAWVGRVIQAQSALGPLQDCLPLHSADRRKQEAVQELRARCRNEAVLLQDADVEHQDNQGKGD